MTKPVMTEPAVIWAVPAGTHLRNPHWRTHTAKKWIVDAQRLPSTAYVRKDLVEGLEEDIERAAANSSSVGTFSEPWAALTAYRHATKGESDDRG